MPQTFPSFQNDDSSFDIPALPLTVLLMISSNETHPCCSNSGQFPESGHKHQCKVMCH